ncbi:hypothetical protein B9Z55_022127 [Caenorhabditis nigoni]|uniref:Protein kinase domain-containing protein n=1 Tax=Caenorhabditis nigoni TaxID=1611254 RepID=A0A2G5TUV8_9PELO|nr:hypothetical protein B9Z55_022127 [Caenorhabditis nigoni]
MPFRPAFHQPNFLKIGEILKAPDGDTFVVVGKLGAGACAQVFEAKNEKRNGEDAGMVAMKIGKIEREDYARIKREIEILEIVKNVPNTIMLKKIFSYKCNDVDFQILVLETMGDSLKDLIKDKTVCTPNAIRVGMILLDVFQHFQKLGVVYKDLHAGNVLFSKDLRTMKLIDFGLSEKSPRNSATDDKAYKYIYDPTMITFLMVNMKTNYKNAKQPRCSISYYVNGLKDVRENLLEAGMLFLKSFIDELLDQIKGHLSYPKLKLALATGLPTYSEDDGFIVSSTIPPSLV